MMAAQPSDMAIRAGSEVQLLEQRIAVQERLNSKQSDRIEKLEGEVAEARGAQKQAIQATNSMSRWIGPITSGAIFILTVGVGAGIYGKLDTASEERKNMQIEMQKHSSEIEALGARRAPDLSAIDRSIATFDARFVSLELSMRTQDRTDLRHDSEIAAANRERAELAKMLVGIRTELGSSLVEVETQIRSFNEVFCTKMSDVNQKMALLWKRAYNEDMPADGYCSSKIPAQAITIIGGGSVQP